MGTHEDGRTRLIENTAGELEREAKSRRFNALEAIGIYVFILVLLWPAAFGLGIMGGVDAVRHVSTALLVVGACFLLFVSPFLHRDTHCSWGLGHPVALWRQIRESAPASRWTLIAIVAALFIGLNLLNWWRWHDVAKFFNFNGTVLERAIDGEGPGRLFVAAFGTLLAAVILGWGIRYDNFLSALRPALAVALPLFALICIAAYVQRGPEAFEDFDPAKFGLGVFGYLFWGFTQQLLFSAYFGTRMRKAFAPSRAPSNAVPRARRPAVALAFGAAAAVVGGAGLLLALRAAHPPEMVPVRPVLWFMLFLLPAGALYGHFYARDKRRMLVATLTATFFGLIHIDSYGLTIGTWLLGIPLTYLFMEDRYRNLVALGFIHGLNGSTLGWLFSSGRSGALEIDYGVGPWNVDAPGWGVLVFPMLCIVAYGALALLCYRRLPGARGT